MRRGYTNVVCAAPLRPRVSALVATAIPPPDQRRTRTLPLTPRTVPALFRAATRAVSVDTGESHVTQWRTRLVRLRQHSPHYVAAHNGAGRKSRPAIAKRDSRVASAA